MVPGVETSSIPRPARLGLAARFIRLPGRAVAASKGATGLPQATPSRSGEHRPMKKPIAVLMIAAACAALLTSLAPAERRMREVEVGGQRMYPMKDIVDNAVNSADHTTLVAAVKAAGLVETLKGKGPFTVFAPTNDAFENLPSGTVESLLKPEAKPTLTRVLTYHVVAGRLGSEELRKGIQKNGGAWTLKTVSGGTLWAKLNGPANVVLQDEAGHTAHISTYDVNQSNGVIHVIDRVVMPKM
jgi:uncharacterized surface protein with fasciclin (FAS1) repeats